MARILVAYATRYGQTAKVARRLEAQLRGRGHRVDLAEVGAREADQLVARSDAVIIAAAVYNARHPRRLRAFVRRHRELLAARPSGFVSVCGVLGGNWSDAASEARRYVDAFLDWTHWQPIMVVSVAGALAYRQYGPITRWFMRRVSAWTGRPTDTSRNYEFTNWDDVDRFAMEFNASLEGEVPAVATQASSPG